MAGATVSSHAVIGAVTKALEKAGRDIQALKQKVDKDEDTPTVTEKETDVIVIELDWLLQYHHMRMEAYMVASK